MKKLIALTTAAAFLAVAAPALAKDKDWHSTTVTVNNTNSSYVSNTVNTSSNTGGNVANGGSASNSVSGLGDNGGNSATGGNGGLIETGNATSYASVVNGVNSNNTNVDLCGCNTSGHGKTTIGVNNYNSALVGNTVNTSSNTGYNTANGGNAGNSVTGPWWTDPWNGGNSAHGGNAGTILTSDAYSESGVVNVVGSNVTVVK